MQPGARLGSQWTTRRKHCVQGPVRRAHPASGATWNVQVVRGKVTSKCLWHACRALSLGLLLMVLGAAMATIGYYADQLSVGQEIRGNATVRVKNESRGFHLNNLSYAGPIVMGVGGFIVVAACVMTFEARDSAAKVMPARFKMAACTKVRQAAASARRSAGSQTGRWEQHLGVFKSSPTSSDRRALTAAFMQFSRTLGAGENRTGHCMSQRLPMVSSLSPADRRRSVPRSGSVPNLEARGGSTAAPPPVRVPLRRPTRSGCALLNPATLPRQALSVDETHVRSVRYSRESLAGSQGSMALDLHFPSDGPVTLRVRDRSRSGPRTTRIASRPPTTRSDTARRHMLSRQKPIDDEEQSAHSNERSRDTHSCSPHLPSYQRTLTQDSFGSTGYERRRNSNASDTMCSRRARRRDIRTYVAIRRSASTSPKPRRCHRGAPPTSLDLEPAIPICEDDTNDTVDTNDLSPDLVQSEYHTVCDEHVITISQDNTERQQPHLNSNGSRDSRISTDTGTLHTAEINISDDGMMEYDQQAETPSSSQTENDADADLTEDITPTFNSDITSSKLDENDASTIIDVACNDPLDDPVVDEE